MSTTDTSNLVHGVIPNLAFLLEHNDNVASAYLCTANATQISKTSEEGAHFCGYRNIQMLLAAQDHELNGTNAEIPTISDLQARIEEAWKAGYNSHGMTQTGGICGTRKHIGTSEVFQFRIVQCCTFLTFLPGRGPTSEHENFLYGQRFPRQERMEAIARLRSCVFLQSLHLVGSND